MKKTLSILALFFVISGYAQSPVLYWDFDSNTDLQANRESITGTNLGNYRFLEGVKGNCVKFDEYTTLFRWNPNQFPELNSRSFTIEAWIAPHSYPWNWCPILVQKTDTTGFFFGIDADGRFGLHVYADGRWNKCNTRPPLPGLEEQTIVQFLDPKPVGKADPVLKLLKWSHLAGVFDAQTGIRLYLNGEKVGELPFNGEMIPATGKSLFLGRNEEKQYVAHMERPIANDKFYYSYDGLMDELKVYDRALSEEEIQKAFHSVTLKNPQPLTYKKIPTGPKGNTKFGAYMTSLKYDEDWDRTRRFGDYSDIVVTFDGNPYKLIYWNGTSYYPTWWTSNDIGIAHEGPETWKPGTGYCYEAMMDRQCRYSRVSIIENNEARVRILWRFNCADMNYNHTNIDTLTNWSDWAEDLYTIYPDGIASREVTLWSTTMPGNHTFEQENYIIQPGMLPEDILEKEVLTLLNEDGQEFTYTWEKNPPTAVGEKVLKENVKNSTVNDVRVYFEPVGNTKQPNIQFYNLKSDYKHFMVVRNGAARFGLICPVNDWPWSLYRWNHFPMGQVPSDGRQVFGIDGRPLSSCVSQTQFNKQHHDCISTDRSLTMFFLFGMTKEEPKSIVPISKSWNHPPKLEITEGEYSNEGYNIGERCFDFESRNDFSGRLSLSILSSADSPLYHPVFVLRNMKREINAEKVRLSVDNRKLKQGDDFRVGRNGHVDGSFDLVIWVNMIIEKPVDLTIDPM